MNKEHESIRGVW